MQLAMDYPIFFNNSALQPDFPLYRARVDEDIRHRAWQSVSNLTELLAAPVGNTFAAWNVAAALLFMLELYDPVHEIVLGNQPSPPLLPSGEVWGWLRTFQEHPGGYWLYHPMSPENHYLHAILHRIEGHRIGEAGLPGFDNAKFWFGGGVEQPPWGLGLHPVYASLAEAASAYAPLRACCIRDRAHAVTIPPGRQVEVAAGWDPFAFVDFYRGVVEGAHPKAEDIAAVSWAQRHEFELIFNYSLRLALDPRSDPFLSGAHVDVPVVLHGETYKLWAQRWGGGPTTILLVHGGPGCSHVAFDSLSALLSPLEYEIVFFDQLGSGRSDCADPASDCYMAWPMSLPDFVEQIEQLRRYMGLPAESTVLLGHSWGTMLTIEHALRYPGAAMGYVLAGFPADMAAYMRRMHALGDRNVSDFFGSFICKTRPCPPSFVWSSAQCDPRLDARLLWTDGGMSCTGVLCGWDRLGDLGKITAPALLLIGDSDLAAPEDVRAMAGAMPRATFVEFSDCGHAEWIDASSAFAASLASWLSSLGGSGVAEPAQAPVGLVGRRPLGALVPPLAWLAVAGALAVGAGLYRRGRTTPPTTGRQSPLLAT